MFMIYSCCVGKTRRHPIYSLLNHFLFFNIFLSFDSCIKVLSSPFIRTSHYYMYRTSSTCTTLQFIGIFVNASQSIHLVLIWLIILAERSVFTRFKFLYADYELEQASLENADLRPELAKLKEKTFRSCVIRNSRGIMLGVTYVVAFILATLMSPSYVYYYRSTRICVSLSSDGFIHLLKIFLYFLVFFPLMYYLLALSVIFSKYFGREADPIGSSLQPADRDRITLVKRVTLLKCVVEVILEMHASSYIAISGFLYELLYLIGFVAIITTTLLFCHHEHFFSTIRQKLFGSSSSAGISSSTRGFTFRRQTDSTVVDYSNLVENES